MTFHAMLGADRGTAVDDGLRWELELAADRFGFLADHRVYDWTVVPGTLYLDLPLALPHPGLGAGARAVRDVRFEHMLFLDDGERAGIDVTAWPREDGVAYAIDVRDGPTAGARLSSGLLGTARPAPAAPAVPLEAVLARCSTEIAGDAYYATLREQGGGYGPAFRGIRRVWTARGEAVGLVEAAPSVAGELGSYAFHPALLDACLQVALVAVTGGSPSAGVYLPLGIDALLLHRPPTPAMWVHAVQAPAAPGARVVSVDARLIDSHGDVVAEVTALRGAGTARRRPRRSAAIGGAGA